MEGRASKLKSAWSKGGHPPLAVLHPLRERPRQGSLTKVEILRKWSLASRHPLHEKGTGLSLSEKGEEYLQMCISREVKYEILQLYWRDAMKKLLRLAVVFVMVSSGHSPSEPVASGPDFLSLANITPPSGTALSPGTGVTFTVNLDYQETCVDAALGESGGTITMDIYDQTGKLLSPAVSKTVGNGRGSANFSGHISVPTAGVSQVDVVLTLTPAALNCLLQFQSFTVSATYPVSS